MITTFSELLEDKEFAKKVILDEDIPEYDDISWDTMNPADRERLALYQAKKTALFAKEFVPFYKEHFKSISISQIENINSLEEFALTMPPTTKEHLTHNSSLSFLPILKDGFSPIRPGMINKGTGGSTGRPVTIWFSPEDWRAMAQHIARSIKFDFRHSLDKLRGRKVLGLYHGDHVTNDIYRLGLKLLGMHLISRVSTKVDVRSNYDFLQETRPNGLLAPPGGFDENQTKGITLKEILKLDSRNFHEKAYRLNNDYNPKFEMLLWSSMPLPGDMYNYLKNHLKIPYIQGQYGSTEICPTGATCEHHPYSFHLGYGPNVVNVIHPSGKRLVGEGEKGHLLVTKSAGLHISNGKRLRIVPLGTNLINFRTGDDASLTNVNGEGCYCGRNTPILSNLERKENVRSKLLFGCQVD